MKNKYFSNSLKRLFFLLFLIFCTQSFAQIVKSGDFRSVQDGNWEDLSTWKVFNGTSFQAASSLPNDTTNVFLDSTYTVTITSTGAECLTLNIDGTDDANKYRINTQDFALDVYGRLRLYNGNDTLTSSITGTVNPYKLQDSLIYTGNSGRIRMAGNSGDITSPGEFGSHTLMAGWTIDFAFDNNSTRPIRTQFRCGNAIFTSGTTEVVAAVLRISGDHESPEPAGKLTIKNGATFSLPSGISQSAIEKSGSKAFELLSVEKGGILSLACEDMKIKASKFDIKGTLKLSYDAGTQTFPFHYNEGAFSSTIDSVAILSLKGFGEKQMIASNKIIITDSLILDENAFITSVGNDTISYADGSTLAYLSQTQTYSTGLEFPATDTNVQPPSNLILDSPDGLTLTGDRSINGILHLLNGNLILGNNHFMLGENSQIEGEISNQTLILSNGVGELRKEFSQPGSFMYPIGEVDGIDTTYSPVTINLLSATIDTMNPHYIGVAVDDDKNNLSPSDISSNHYLGRFWKVSGGSGITNANYNFTGKYIAPDINGDESEILTYRYDGVTATPVNSIDANANLLLANNQSGFGNFTGSNFCDVTNNHMEADNLQNFPNGSIFCEAIQSFTIDAADATPFDTYQWQQRIDEGNWEDINTNGTNEDLNVNAIDISGTYEFRRLIISTCIPPGNSIPISFSESFKVTVQNNITNYLINNEIKEICLNESPGTILGNIPSGGDEMNYTFEWQRKFDDGNWEVVGYNFLHHIEEPLVTEGTYEYRRLVSSGSCTDIVSDTLTVIVTNDPPVITAEVSEALVGANNGSIVLSISGGKTPYQFIWVNTEDENTVISGSQNVYDLSVGTYKVTVNDSKGCSSTQTFDIGAITSINESNNAQEQTALKLFPNPTKGDLSLAIDTKLLSQDLKVSITNSIGEIILEKNLLKNRTNSNVKTLNLHKLLTGVYMLTLINEQGAIVTKKFAKF